MLPYYPRQIDLGYGKIFSISLTFMLAAEIFLFSVLLTNVFTFSKKRHKLQNSLKIDTQTTYWFKDATQQTKKKENFCLSVLPILSSPEHTNSKWIIHRMKTEVIRLTANQKTRPKNNPSMSTLL